MTALRILTTHWFTAFNMIFFAATPIIGAAVYEANAAGWW